LLALGAVRSLPVSNVSLGRPSTLISGCSAPRETWPHSAFARSTRHSFLFCDILSSRSHTHINTTQRTLRLDVVSCESRSPSWPVVATTSMNVVRHDVFASFTPAFHPTHPVAPIHAPHTRTGCATCRETWPSSLHSARPPSLSPHSYPVHGHAPSSIATTHMRIAVPVSFHPPSCLLTTDEDSSPRGNSS
jgi:hypothetical protein